MKRFKYIPTIFLAAGLAFVFYACCRDDDNTCSDPTNPECPNYDPCIGVIEPTAEIILQESLHTFEGMKWPGNDSVFLNHVQFSSPYQDDGIAHTWYLGSEVIHDAVFSRSHQSISPQNRPTYITVSHVIEFPVDSTCYINISGRDSTSQTYYLIRYYNEYMTLGEFRAVFENQTDSFDFKLSAINLDGSDAQIYGNNITMIAVNFHNEGDSLTGFRYSVRNSLGNFDGDGSANPRGFLTKTDEFGIYKLEYQYGLEYYTLMARKID